MSRKQSVPRTCYAVCTLCGVLVSLAQSTEATGQRAATRIYLHVHLHARRVHMHLKVEVRPYHCYIFHFKRPRNSIDEGYFLATRSHSRVVGE